MNCLQLVYGLKSPIYGYSNHLIGKMTCLCHWVKFPIVSALVYMVIHWAKSIMSPDISCWVIMTSLSYYTI